MCLRACVRRARFARIKSNTKSAPTNQNHREYLGWHAPHSTKSRRPFAATSMIDSPSTVIYRNLREEALQVLEDEPELKFLLHRTVLHSSVTNFSEAIAMTACYRLLLTPCESKQMPQASPVFCPHTMKKIIVECMDDKVTLEKGHTMQDAVAADILAVCRRDPAMNTPCLLYTSPSPRD